MKALIIYHFVDYEPCVGNISKVQKYLSVKIIKNLDLTHPIVVIFLVHLDLIVVAAGRHHVVVRMPCNLQIK